jgi:hypothetical protein
LLSVHFEIISFFHKTASAKKERIHAMSSSLSVSAENLSNDAVSITQIALYGSIIPHYTPLKRERDT